VLRTHEKLGTGFCDVSARLGPCRAIVGQGILTPELFVFLEVTITVMLVCPIIDSNEGRRKTMNSRSWFVAFGVVFLFTLSFGCAPQDPPEMPDNRSADEAALRKADKDWSNAAQMKQVDSWVAFYTDDATVLPPNDKAASGKDAIGKTIGDMLALPGFSVSWQPTTVEVARSGDIGYAQGTYELMMNDPKGNPITDRGKYLEVWKKQADGTWKCSMDMFNSDLPAVPPPPSM
jgi:ketosteroid isomerase-like protein